MGDKVIFDIEMDKSQPQANLGNLKGFWKSFHAVLESWFFERCFGYNEVL